MAVVTELPQRSVNSPSLDAPPPLPPGVGSREARPALETLGGTPSGGTLGESAIRAIFERHMLVEQGLDELAKVSPSLAPVVDDIKMRLRQGVAPVVMAARQGSPSTPSGPMTGGAGPMGM